MGTIHTTTLACGMPLITETMSGVESAAITWLLPAGSAHDPDNRQGISALWAELLLRGAGKHSSRDLADTCDRLGLARSTEVGAYTLRIGGTLLGSRVLEALPLFADMARAPRMDEDAIEPTRDLALQALASLKDDPQERALLLARERHQPVPLNRSGMGNEEGIKALTRDELLSFWHQTAKPASSIFAVAGAIDPDAIKSTLNSLFAGWSGSVPDVVVGPTPPRGYAHAQDPTSQVQIVLVHDAPAETNDDCVYEKIVVSVLSGGMSGRLFTEVREKRGLCYAVSAGYRGDRDFGLVSAYVGTTPERAQQSLDVLRAELDRLHTPAGAITREEFDRALIGLKSGLVFSGESTGARAGSLAVDFRRLGRARSLEEMAERYARVTLDDVNAYLQRRSHGKITVQTLGPAALTCNGV
jgi:predicted Zn-dependent peptidase